MFTIYDWIYGIAQFAASFLAIIAILISVSLFRSAWKIRILNAWKFMLIALVLFAFEEVMGGLKTFGIVTNLPFITHIIPTVILGFMIAGIVVQINVRRGWHR